MAEQFSWDRTTPGFIEDTGVSTSQPAPCGRRAHGWGDHGPGGGAQYVDQDAFGADFAYCPWDTWDNREVWVRQGVATVAFLNERRIHELAKAWRSLSRSEQSKLAGSKAPDVTRAFDRWTTKYPLSRWKTEPTDNPAVYANWRAVTNRPISSATDGRLVAQFPWGTLGVDDRVSVHAVPAIQSFFSSAPVFARFRAWMADFVSGATGGGGRGRMSSMSRKMADAYQRPQGFPAREDRTSTRGRVMSSGATNVQRFYVSPAGTAAPSYEFDLYGDGSVKPASNTSTYVAVGVGAAALAGLAWWYLR